MTGGQHAYTPPMAAALDTDSPAGMLASRSLPPSLAHRGARAVLCNGDGGERALDAESALRALAERPHLVCHRTFLASRLARSAGSGRGARDRALEPAHLDVAELFAFVRPAQAGLPTPEGLARALAVEAGTDPIRTVATTLLDELQTPSYPHVRETMQVATTLSAAGWPWGRLVLAALSAGQGGREAPGAGTGLNVWDRLADWEDSGPMPPPGSQPVSGEEAAAALDRLVGSGAESRPDQRAYAQAAAAMFAAKAAPGENHIMLAEAGTGLGKTLGYLAPAGVWAQRNKAAVWISTYTKNLQRQLVQEAARLYPDPAERAERAVIRKGRENYMCLLNLAERITQLNRSSRVGVTLAGLVARWARYTRDGDMVGGDFPAWLIPLFMDGAGASGQPPSPMQLGLTDRRGECIYSACAHYRKCFIERAVRKARKADIVIANHAFVMAQTAIDRALAALAPARPADGGEGSRPALREAGRRLVFDEGHHVFDAADGAFSSHLTGLETAEMRRWVCGPEGGRRRGRGLSERIGDLIGDDEQAGKLLEAAMKTARELPGPGWLQRLATGAPQNAAERFLALVRQQVHARTEGQPGGFSLETECAPPIVGLIAAADGLAEALDDLARPLKGLAIGLHARLDADADELDTSTRIRIEAMVRSLDRRSALALMSWRHMLACLQQGMPEDFVDWFAIEMAFGRESDIGMHRHWLDPSRPFAEAVLETSDGVLITSATLRDRPPETPDDWSNAEMRTGVSHLALPVQRRSFASPFDYGRQARLYVVTDVRRDDPSQIAAAYRELFIAAGGGALGLFTAIHRLRTTYDALVDPLAEAGLPLYAQHIDPMDTGTLVDLFRADENACLLGTDAVRDGVDVPGDSLRLIVFDRVPWPKPTILERRRREAFGGARYQDMTTRLRLQQAFGRLIRRQSDRGVFVVLDSRLPTRLTTAFPEPVMIRRVGLVEAIEGTAEFLENTAC